VSSPPLSDPTAANAEQPFSRMATWVLTAGAITSLLTSFLLLVFRNEDVGEVSVANDSYSVSALGHHLLYELLRATGRPVTQNRMPNGSRAPRSLLVLAEPDRSDLGKFQSLVSCGRPTLVVLPKRTGDRDPATEHWIASEKLRPESYPQALLGEISTATVDRFGTAPDTWQFAGAIPELPAPQIDDLQLLTGSGFRPLIRCRQGTLLAELSRTVDTVYVLSDPDVLANHGIDDGNNAEFVLGMLDALREGRGIILDETLHGFEIAPSVWAELGRFPLVLLLAHMFLLLAIVGWLAVSRFGPIVVPPRPLTNDKQFLLDNTASLLMRANHSNVAVRRYFRDRTRLTAQRLGLKGDNDEALLTALTQRAAQQGNERFGQVRGEVEYLGRLIHHIHPKEATQLARRIRAVFEELVHGSH
jgi:hypothetical protein